MQETVRQEPVGSAAPACSADKPFRTLQAQFARAGHQLHRTNPADGDVSYYSSRWGMTRELHDLDQAREFLRQIGGAA